MRIEFKKKVYVKNEGIELEGIELNLDDLTGEDLERAQELVAQSRKGVGNVPEFNKAYISQVAAFAANLPVEVIRGLPAKQYTLVTLEVQNFLLDGDSEEEMMPSTSFDESPSFAPNPGPLPQ